MKEVYLDNAATTKIDSSVLSDMVDCYKNQFGNASSIYKIGRDARACVENSREVIAKILNAKPEEIYFTSGGSESDNMAVKGIAHAYKNKGKHIITSKIEHPAVLETCKALEKEGFSVTYLNVDSNGIVDLEELKSAIRPDTILISIMFANNEIGTIEPIKEIGKVAKEHNVIFHTDAVQAVGTLKIDVKNLNIDAMSLSGHKFYGPKGIGALYLRQGIIIDKLICGGHQEKNRRAGTENVPAIVGMAKAMELAYADLEENEKRIKELRDYYEESIIEKIPYIKLNGDKNNRLPGTSNISFRFIEGEGLLLNLDLKGICASSGSACTSGSLDPSHVLLAIGLSHEVAHGSLRISIGRYNTKYEIDYLIDSLVEIVGRLREMSPLWEKFIEEEKV